MKKALLIASLILLACATSVPNIVFTQSYPTFTYAAFPNDTCSKLMLTKNHIFRLGANNVVTVNSKSSLARVATMTNYTYTTTGGTLVAPNLINDFDVDEDQTYITITQKGFTRILNLMSFTLKFPLPASFFKVLFSNNVLSGAVKNFGTNNLYFQVTFSSHFIPTSIELSPTALTDVKDCKLMQSPNRHYHVYWDQFSNVFVYNATNTSAGPVYLGKVVGNSPRANLTQAISFSSDSRYFIIEADNALPVKIVSLVPTSFLAVKSFSFNGAINKAMFLDSQNAFIVLFGGTTATFFQVASLGFLYSQAFSLQSQQIEIDYSTNQVFICKNSSVEVYRTGMRVVVCRQNCQRCVNSSECLACVPKYVLEGGVCVAGQAAPNSPNSPNSPSFSDPSYSASSLSNSSDSLPVQNLPIQNSGTNTTEGMSNTSTEAKDTDNANDSKNQTYYNQNNNDDNGHQNNNSSNNTDSNSSSSNSSEMRMFVIMIMPDGTVMKFELTDLQALLVNSTQNALKMSNDLLQKTMVYLSSSPLIYLALGNLQFFTVSSIYTLLNVPIPQIIKNILNATASSLNANMFTILKISLSVPSLGVQRVSQERLASFGVGSLFLPNNYQYMILSTMSIFVFFGMRIILRAFPQSKTLYYFLGHNKSAVIFGLVLSGMNGIILPFSDVYQNSWSLYFEDKINQIIQFLIIGLVLIFGALYLATVASNSAQKGKNKETLKKVKSKQKQLKFMTIRKEMDNIYLLIINLSFPISVIFSNPYYFLFSNQVVLLFGFFIAKKSTRFRVNKIILSIYPLLFHLCFFIFNFSRDSSILIYTQIACILLYFIGSIHELLTIFFQLCYFLYKFIRMKMVENRVQPDPNDNKLELKKTHKTFAKSPSTNINSPTRSAIPPRTAIKIKVNFKEKAETIQKKNRKVMVTREGDIDVFHVNLLRLTKRVPENKEKRKGLMASTFSLRNNRKVDEG